MVNVDIVKIEANTYIKHVNEHKEGYNIITCNYNIIFNRHVMAGNLKTGYVKATQPYATGAQSPCG